MPKIEALKARLLSGVPAEARTAEQEAQWLAAQLLEWHWREDKSAWWEFFRMSELSEAEMIEEPRPIGGVHYVGPVGTVKRSTVHRYSFPPQEHGISQATDCQDPASGTKIRFAVFDAAARTFDVTRKIGAPAPSITSLVPIDIIATAKHRARLKEFAEFVAAEGINSRKGDFRLARDLLLRVSPATGATTLVSAGETAAGAAVRLAVQLARSERGGVLPIQGPPGCGKTHTGAEMILDLLRHGFKVGVTANSHKVIGNLLKKTCELGIKAGETLQILQRAKEDQESAHPFVTNRGSELGEKLREPGARIAAGTSWLWTELEPGSVDVLFVDEAGQMSLANVVAMSHSARVLVLLGDPMQLDQPRKGVHPPGAEASALEHVLHGGRTMTGDRGLFLETTWRLHPALCRYTSEAFYESRLEARPENARQVLDSAGPLAGTGMRWLPVEHVGNQDESQEEVDAIKKLFEQLRGCWTDAQGRRKSVAIEDILVVAPYNAQVRMLAALPEGARVGTVDKFQGQEAPVVIYSMTTSTPQDAPRGMEFLYSLNRLNVATSRAQCVAVVVGSPALLRPVCKMPRQLMQASALCAAVEHAEQGKD